MRHRFRGTMAFIICFVMVVLLLPASIVSAEVDNDQNGDGRYDIINTKKITGEDIVSEAKKWIGCGAIYDDGKNPTVSWPDNLLRRMGFPRSDGVLRFDCSGFVSRVLNDAGLRSNELKCNYWIDSLTERYGENYISADLSYQRRYGTNIDAEVMRAKNGDWSGMRAGDIITFVSSKNHVLIFAGLNSSGEPMTIEVYGNGTNPCVRYGVIFANYPQYFEHGARLVDSTSNYISKCKQFPSYCSVKVTADSAPIWTLPCSDSTDTSSRKIETASKNTTYTANKLIFNDQNHYWYRVTAKTGSTGYIYAGNCSYTGYVNDLSIKSPSAPSSLVVGNVFSIGGTVTAEYSELTNVSAYVYPNLNTSGSAETGTSVSVSGNSYSLKGSTIDKAVEFNKLSLGRHTYVVAAKSICYYATSATAKTSVTNSSNLFTQSFYVTEPEPETHRPVGKLTELSAGEKKVYLKGWAYDEDYIDFYGLTVYITIDGNKWPCFITAHQYDSDVPISNKNKGFSDYLYPDVTGEHDVAVYICDLSSNGENTGDVVLIGSARLNILPEHQHVYEKVVVEPTCTEPGYDYYKCSCGDSYDGDTIPALGHDYFICWLENPAENNGKADLELWCLRCDHIETETIQSNADYESITVKEEPTCTSYGLTEYVYKIKHKPSKTSTFMAYIEMLPHAYQNTVVPPTCTTDGYTLKKCSVCGAEEQTDTVAALGHKYVKGICERCGEKDPDAPDAKKGDLDNDGEITSADAVLLMRSLATLAELTDEQHTAADLDGDGYITSADAVMMARYLAGLVYSFD